MRLVEILDWKGLIPSQKCRQDFKKTANKDDNKFTKKIQQDATVYQNLFNIYMKQNLIYCYLLLGLLCALYYDARNHEHQVIINAEKSPYICQRPGPNQRVFSAGGF
jgi:hypothetical protein